jgi:hypothetical protein
VPRQTDLVGYRFAVATGQEPVMDNGQLVHDGRGQPKLQTITSLILQDQFGDVVTIKLTDQARRELITGLTGGVEIPQIQIAH